MNEEVNEEVLPSSPIESLMWTIMHKQQLVRECLDLEKRTSSDRNGYECVISNTVHKLAKQLVADLGNGSAMALTRVLAEITGWRPPVQVNG